MAAPTKYVQSYDFSDFQEANPADPLPADQVDAQFALLKTTTDETIDALANVRRSDGALVNGIVTPDSFSAAALLLIESGFVPRGEWVTATAYAVNDVVSLARVPYICLVAHTSGVFATDLAAGKWQSLGQSAIAVDGSSTVTADIPFNAHKLTGVAAGVSGTDAVNKAQMDAADALLDAAIDANTANIATNTANIATNTANIATNTADIAANTTLLATYFSGFALSNNGSDATHDIDVGVGYARDGAANFNWITTATIVKQTDVAFAEYVAPGTASGGMDSTTLLGVGAAVVHVFMVGGAGKNTQPFCSTNIAPSLPTGFTNKVYVNSLWWDGSALLPFKQRGRDEIQLTTPPTPVSTTNPATTARTITLASFPTGVELLAKVSLLVLTTTAAATTGLSALDVTNQDPATAFGFDVMVTSSTGEFDASVGWVKTNTSGQIRARCSAGGAANSEKITTLGWRVMR